MIPNSDVPGRPSLRIVLLSKLKRTSMRLGSLTLAFFRKGEGLEATGFETVHHDDPTLVPQDTVSQLRQDSVQPRARGDGPCVGRRGGSRIVWLAFDARSPGRVESCRRLYARQGFERVERLKALVGHPVTGRSEDRRDRAPDVAATSESRPFR
jgi:hypothetical protein